MRNKIGQLVLAVFLFSTTSGAAIARSKTYIYRQRANWVKLIKLSNKQMAGETLNHPYNIAPDQMEGMLLSLNMKKGSMFKSDFKTSEIFSVDEAKKYAPFIVDALAMADPNQVVNISIVHKRTKVILKNDFLSMINVFANDEGVHFYFVKLFAKLHSDYEQASKMDRAIIDAKSLRVMLDSGPGQKLAYNGNEIILDPKYDFVENIQRTVVAEETYSPRPRREKKAKRQQRAVRDDAQVASSSTDSGDTASRLRKLDELKRQKLITPAEYNVKRKEILGDI